MKSKIIGERSNQVHALIIVFLMSIVNYGNIYSGQLTSQFLGVYQNQVYFSIDKHNIDDKWYEGKVYRYDPQTGKVVCLREELSVFDKKLEYEIETDRGSIIIHYRSERHSMDHIRIDAMSGAFQNRIETTIDERSDINERYIYEVVTLDESYDFFICEYDKETKKTRVICAIDFYDSYQGRRLEKPIREGNTIYFTDCTHYLTSEEELNPVWPPIVHYYKVNIVTNQVIRITEKEFKYIAS